MCNVYEASINTIFYLENSKVKSITDSFYCFDNVPLKKIILALQIA